MASEIRQVCSIQNLHAYDIASGRGFFGLNVGVSCCRYSPVIDCPTVWCNKGRVPCYGAQDQWTKARRCIVLIDNQNEGWRIWIPSALLLLRTHLKQEIVLWDCLCWGNARRASMTEYDRGIRTHRIIPMFMLFANYCYYRGMYVLQPFSQLIKHSPSVLTLCAHHYP